MVRSRKRRVPLTGRQGPVRGIYLRIALMLMAVIIVASFYVYQRVWVRNLVTEIEELEEQNDKATLRLNRLREKWMAASSITSIEEKIKELGSRLRPTLPDQNLVVRPLEDGHVGRYSGLLKALRKIKTHMPVVGPNEADAEQLFEK
jgi:cell division protein FtsL